MALKLQEWCDTIQQRSSVTIEDITNLNKGDQLELLLLDRNFVSNVTNEKHDADKNYNPSKFFGEQRAIYTHNKNLQGELKTFYEWDLSDDPPIQIEFHIEYMPDHYYPLKKGSLPAKDPDGIFDFPWTKKKKWTEFSPETKVGFFGPIVLWNEVANMPKVYFSSIDFPLVVIFGQIVKRSELKNMSKKEFRERFHDHFFT